MTQRIGTALITTSRGVNLPGTKPGKARRKPRTVLTGTSPSWAVELVLPCRVVTEANTHEHWTAGAARAKAQKEALEIAWVWAPFLARWMQISEPLVITMTHYGPRMDDDNLARAFKAIRDAIANRLGRDDGDSRVSWQYRQERGAPGVRVRIEPRTGSDGPRRCARSSPRAV